MLIIGTLGLLWGILSVKQGAASDALRDLEGHLLRFETYRPSTAMATLQGNPLNIVSACDTHAQRALMLMEIPLAEAALKSGAVEEFNERSRSLETRARLTLSCSPRDAFVWLLLFALENAHGLLEDHTFALLAMSYDSSPNEAWIANRRILLTIPVLSAAPETLRSKILTEFGALVRSHFVEVPALAYFKAPPSVRFLLQSELDLLSPEDRSSFDQALAKLHS